MVDISGKSPTRRRARAAASVVFPGRSLARVLREGSPKGDLFAAARVAGVQAAKRTSELIPLCHPLPLSRVGIDFEVRGSSELAVECEASAEARTGVEMEALTGAAVAALTIYDMVKALGPGIEVRRLRLLEKTGGLSGDWRAAGR
jgi:cyclic pyranopterin monophosphate synthase